MADPLPDDVRRFIHRHLDSVSLLEVLLLLRRDAERWWPPDEVAVPMKMRPGAAEGFLTQLGRQQLVEEDAGRYRYAVPSTERRAVDHLAEAFARRRHSVIGEIFAPRDEAATSPAQTLADAFRLRRKGD